MRPIRIKLLPKAASATTISASASPGAGPIVIVPAVTLPGGIDPQAGTALGLGRIITLVSGSDDSAHAFTIVGFDENGVAATEAVTGGSSTTVVSTKYYTSVTSITYAGTVAGTFSAGITNTTASAKFGMLPLNFYGRSPTICAVSVGGTISYTVQLTFGDIIGGSIALAKADLFATLAGTTGITSGFSALTTASSSLYTQLVPGVTGISVTIPTYTSTGFIIVNVIQPTNSNAS